MKQELGLKMLLVIPCLQFKAILGPQAGQGQDRGLESHVRATSLSSS